MFRIPKIDSARDTIFAMRTTALWAFWRRSQYLAGFAALFLAVGAWIYFANFYKEPTCFDGSLNGDETGVDCGGSCIRICADSVGEPTVKWSRSFRVSYGIYNAVAYVENLNETAASPEIEYTFTFYDEAGLITERKGKTILPPSGLYPIFEGRVETGSRVPTRTLIEIKKPEIWQPATSGREQFTVVERSLEDSDSRPRLSAVLRNEGLSEVREVEIVATIFDSQGTALATSRTFVDNFAPRSDTEIAFTWPEPIARTIRSCEIPTDVVLAIDLSGSMNNDQANPPEPLTSVKKAAANFVARLKEKDQAGIVTFATNPLLFSALSGNAASLAGRIDGLVIDPKEETGYTNTGEGIKLATAELVSERHNGDARKVMVLLTDGLATAPGEESEAETYALEAAAVAKSNNIELYAIGLGAAVKMDFVTALASTPQHSYQALSRVAVEQIYQEITSALCEEGAAVIDIVPKSSSGFVPLR